MKTKPLWIAMETVYSPAELIIHYLFLKKRSIVYEVGRGVS